MIADRPGRSTPAHEGGAPNHMGVGPVRACGAPATTPGRRAAARLWADALARAPRSAEAVPGRSAGEGEARACRGAANGAS
jgi:hypothetical protein